MFNVHRTVTVKDITTGKVNVIYNAKEALSGMKTPMVKDPKVHFFNSIRKMNIVLRLLKIKKALKSLGQIFTLKSHGKTNLYAGHFNSYF